MTHANKTIYKILLWYVVKSGIDHVEDIYIINIIGSIVAKTLVTLFI